MRTAGVGGGPGPGSPEACPRGSAAPGAPAQGGRGGGRWRPADRRCFPCRFPEAGRRRRLLGGGGPRGRRTLRGGRVHPLQVQKARPPGRSGVRWGLGQGPRWAVGGERARLDGLRVLNGRGPGRDSQLLTIPRPSSTPASCLPASRPHLPQPHLPWREAPSILQMRRSGLREGMQCAQGLTAEKVSREGGSEPGSPRLPPALTTPAPLGGPAEAEGSQAFCARLSGGSRDSPPFWACCPSVKWV